MRESWSARIRECENARMRTPRITLFDTVGLHRDFLLACLNSMLRLSRAMEREGKNLNSAP